MENIPRKIELEDGTLHYLNVTRKWTMFLSVLGFIFLGLMLVTGLIAVTFLSAFKTGGTGLGLQEYLMFFAFFVCMVVFFFPIHFLFRFSKQMTTALQTLDKVLINKAFRNLKSYFVYFGIMIIVFLSFYIAALIITGTSLRFFKGH
jgi:hypothetical protein